MADLKLTAEMQKKLREAGVLGFQVEAPFPYTPKAYRNLPKELWAIFTLRSKDGVELANIEDRTSEYTLGKDETTMQIKSGSVRIETLKLGILKMKNYLMEDGTVLDYDKSTETATYHPANGGKPASKDRVPVEDVIRHIPIRLQMELQNAINERSTMTDEEVRGLKL